MFHRFQLSVCLLLTTASSLRASTLLTEGFNDITTLPGSGWVQTNNSTTGGTTSWFQGDPASSFSTPDGPANSFIEANFNNALFGGNISNWLILPNMILDNGDILIFITRTETGAVPGDELQVRLSTNGGSTDVGATTTSVGDFTTSLLDIPTPYPEVWTLETVTLSGLAGPTSARLAFRYVVTDTSANGDVIGIDSVSVSTPLPEPSTAGLLLAGLAVGAFAFRSRFAFSKNTL